MIQRGMNVFVIDCVVLTFDGIYRDFVMRNTWQPIVCGKRFEAVSTISATATCMSASGCSFGGHMQAG